MNFTRTNLATKILIPLTLAAAAVGCGYSKPTMAATTTPMIAQLSPASANAGAATFQLEVDGASFASSAVINFNGAALTTTFVSGGKLEAMIPASAIAASGAVPVTVTNPATTGLYGTPAVTSTAMTFTIN
jgi:hypothetical protein